MKVHYDYHICSNSGMFSLRSHWIVNCLIVELFNQKVQWIASFSGCLILSLNGQALVHNFIIFRLFNLKHLLITNNFILFKSELF